MKIVIVSLSFLPNVGGLENIMGGLAEEWGRLHDVIVYTKSQESDVSLPVTYKIIRKYSFLSLFRSIKMADLYVEANISLKTCLAGLFFYRKWYVIHHLCYTDTFKGKIKNVLSFLSNNISCSSFVSSRLFGNSYVINNFYDDRIFKLYSLNRKNNLIVFVGRLVSDKGIDLLINAISILNKEKKLYQLLIIGCGPEEKKILDLIKFLNLMDVVFFKGVLKGKELAYELNKCEIMVIPSRWKEPFGIVALEGLACGCKIVCPDQGGLVEAAGKSAFLFRHNNLESLISAIKESSNSKLNVEADASISYHLFRHTQSYISSKYLAFFDKGVNC